MHRVRRTPRRAAVPARVSRRLHSVQSRGRGDEGIAVREVFATDRAEGRLKKTAGYLKHSESKERRFRRETLVAERSGPSESFTGEPSVARSAPLTRRAVERRARALPQFPDRAATSG